MKREGVLLFTTFVILGLQLGAHNSLPADCRIDQFSCSNRRCIPYIWKCDGADDCGDNSDERFCTWGITKAACTAGEWKCANKRCIDERLKCNLNDDCGDASDEANCTYVQHDSGCPMSNNFMCDNGKCIPQSLTCNGEDDCFDNSDEAVSEEPYCTPKEKCASGYFGCKKTGQCIPNALVCDGVHFNCGDDDDSDEEECKQRQCGAREFKCDNGKCIFELRKCDRQNDCGDSSDEANCDYGPCSAKKCPFFGKCYNGFDGKARCTCSIECPPIGDAVCGSDGKMYQNECLMKSASCDQQKDIKVVPNAMCKCTKLNCKHYATCGSLWNGELGCRCNTECSRERRLVCGSNFKTYLNECFMKMDSCLQQKDIGVLYKSPCKCSSFQCPYYGTCRTGKDGYGECICSQECSHHKRPVTGSNSKRYRNICYLQMDSCMKRQEIWVIDNDPIVNPVFKRV